MKRSIGFLMTVIITAAMWGLPSHAAVVFAAEEPEIVAQTAVLIDCTTGRVLYDKNMHEKKHPASTTKMMTAILAIENLAMDQVLVADQEAAAVKTTSIDMKKGEEFTVEQLLNMLLIKSANDAAMVLAKAVGGDIEGFATMMNAKAKEIGARNTNFVNPHGLTDDEHMTTAYDLAVIARYAMENTAFREIVQTEEYSIPPTNLTKTARTTKSGNEMMYNIKTLRVDGKKITTKYEAATGVKAGSTKRAGRCFVTSAIKDGRELIGVVLQSNADNVTLDSIKLLDYGFDHFENYIAVSALEYSVALHVKSGKAKQLNGCIKEDVIITIDKGTLNDLQIKVEEDIPESITAPIDEGTVIGTCNVYIGDVLEKQINILAAESVQESSWVDLLSTINRFIKKVAAPVGIIAAILVALVTLYAILALRLSGRRKGRMQRRRGKKNLMFSKNRRR